MTFDSPLIKSRFVRRKNRFLMEVDLERNGERVDVHLADSARLTELLLPGKTVCLSETDSPKRKTRYTARLIENQFGNGLVSIYSTLPNQLAECAIQNQFIDGLRSWHHTAREVKWGKSRFDHVLERNGRQLILEVKGITWVDNECAFFPGAVTERGRRHVEELEALHNEGSVATAILFVVQRPDAKEVRLADEVDPAFCNALRKAADAGVKLFACTMNVALTHVSFGQVIPVRTEEISS
ncbi:sugar fermentation stimulation protein [[Bacillus] selenitireducens MLS10]|uniref:Sugar fermentation stimulation protein homolog n=1 Tax=Bacillus selenitireducens (strain ATCC 700615 / DSM 15326 / MLS10) TaxID=439292 RepID=D6XXL2_BACIE|nr:sugar fermentation stimulation protein [[Bacillus] selenitireducens MLS10]